MQPESSGSRFLTLPREVRNQIYRYLHRDLELRAIRKIGASRVFVRLTSTPYPNVFLVHPRLNTEYRESGPARHTTAIVFNQNARGNDESNDDSNDGSNNIFWDDDDTTIRKDEEALRHIKSVTLRYCPDRDNPEADPVDLLTHLCSTVPDLQTIRIAECSVVRTYIGRSVPEYAGQATYDELKHLPDTIASLPLRQRANCNRITTRNARRSSLRKFDEHLVSQCRTHLYSAYRMDSDLWTDWDVIYGKMPRNFVEWTDHMAKESGVTFKADVGRVVAWKEEECAVGNKSRMLLTLPYRS